MLELLALCTSPWLGIWSSFFVRGRDNGSKRSLNSVGVGLSMGCGCSAPGWFYRANLARQRYVAAFIHRKTLSDTYKHPPEFGANRSEPDLYRPTAYSAHSNLEGQSFEKPDAVYIKVSALTSTLLACECAVELAHTLNGKSVTISVDSGTEAASVKEFCIQTYSDKQSFAVTELQIKDVILGMPWLKRRNPDVDWRNGSLKLRLQEISHTLKSDENGFCIPVISAVQFAKGVKRKDPAWVCIIKSAGPDSNGKPQLDCSALLQEFADVEAEPSFPEPRNVDHAIELEPGTTPKMGPIYWLAPAELQELQKQLQELLEKGLIEPSSSPYGAPVEKKRKEKLRRKSNSPYIN
eukprot:1146458-Pelagomonas_calceolata.AAC.9